GLTGFLGRPVMAGAVPMPLALMGAQQSVRLWQAPYPPPEAIERYEKVLPGSFDRMIKMAEGL
ncbi:MAG TPA: DUF2335 domain-containing protein, partial [Stellaceae bacterium]|nr:DUF2335 domain-containing protein [Stellaceae bacterium]